MEEWLVECARLKISIKAKEALEAIAAFQGVKPGSQTQQRQQFTQEHFIKALIEFIVATDQVFFFFFALNFTYHSFIAHQYCGI
jgi:hypothetical protein